MSPRRLTVLAALAATLLLSGCASAGNASSSGGAPERRSAHADPIRVIAGPAGLMDGTAPQLNGHLWVLAGTGGVRTLHELDLAAGRFGAAVPAEGSGECLVQSSSTLLALGLSTTTTGAVQFLNGSSASPVSIVALGGPVRALTAGADGVTFYALNGTGVSESVSVINAISGTITGTVPVPLDTLSIAVDPAQLHLFALESDGEIDVISILGGQVTARFSVGRDPLRVVLSADGNTMYVLQGTGGTDDVAVFGLATETQKRALPAPSDTVAIQVSSDNTTLYTFVGTRRVGNVQLFATR